MKTSNVRILSIVGVMSVALALPACGGGNGNPEEDAGLDGSVRDGATDGATDDMGDMGGGPSDADTDDGVPPTDMGTACEPSCGARVCGLDPTCGQPCGECTTTQACNAGGQCITAPVGSPAITALTVTPSTFGPSTEGTFSATVTDPQGLTNITGGVLRDPESGESYGDFEGSGGVYTITLDWDAINDLRDIDAPAGGGLRIFEAVFTDMSGNMATRQVSATFACGGSQVTCEPGVCVSLSTVTACGSCENDCTDVEVTTDDLFVDATGCQAADPQPYCTITLTENVRQSCDAACSARGVSCDTTEQHFGGFLSGYCAEPCSPVDSACAGGTGTCTTVDVDGTPTDLCVRSGSGVSEFAGCSVSADCDNGGVCQALAGNVVGDPLTCGETPPATIPAVTELGTQTGDFDFARMYCQCVRP